MFVLPVSVQAEERSEEVSAQVFPHLSVALELLQAVNPVAESQQMAAKLVRTAVLVFPERRVSKQRDSMHPENRFSVPRSEYH